MRTWHDASGKFQTEAQFVSLTASVVTLAIATTARGEFIIHTA